MSDLEFEVLDELYFIQSFNELLEVTDLEDADLKSVLKKLLRKEWLQCYENVNDRVDDENLDFDLNFRRYHYLASKKGLLAHNSSKS